MRTRSSRRRPLLLVPLLLVALLLPASPASAHHGSSGRQSVTAANRSSLELFAEAVLAYEHNAQRRAGNTRDGVRYGDVDRVPAMTAHTDIATVARRWSSTFSRSNFRHNPSFGDQLGGWRNGGAVGENIAWATVSTRGSTPTTDEVHTAVKRVLNSWWRSTGHRRAWMSPRYDQFAVGVSLRKDGGRWILHATTNFRDHDGSSLSGHAAYPVGGHQPPDEHDHGREHTLRPTRFADVGADHVFRVPVARMDAKGYTSGCDTILFCVDGRLTRGQMAKFLDLALDLPNGRTRFRDTRGHVFEQHIAALADAGITDGCGNGNFCPDAPITRGQMAKFLDRALRLPRGTKRFEDTRGHVFEAHIAAIADRGITTGCNSAGTRFCPNATVTRGQLAGFLDKADLLD